MSQVALARLSGIHSVTISQLERGTKQPTLATLSALARALRLSISFQEGAICAHPLDRSPTQGGDR